MPELVRGQSALSEGDVGVWYAILAFWAASDAITISQNVSRYQRIIVPFADSIWMFVHIQEVSNSVPRAVVVVH